MIPVNWQQLLPSQVLSRSTTPVKLVCRNAGLKGSTCSDDIDGQQMHPCRVRPPGLSLLVDGGADSMQGQGSILLLTGISDKALQSTQ